MVRLKIFRGLERFGSQYPSEAVKYAMENREEAVPELLEILKYTLSDAERLSKDEDYLIQFPVIYMLAYFREKRAYDDIVKIAYLPDEQAYDLLGDTMTEDFGRILASVCDGNIEPIKKIIEDPTLDEFVRDQALDSLLTLLNNGTVSREQLVFYFKELFNGKLEVDYSDVWDSLPTICSLIHPKGLEEDIEQAVEDKKIMEVIADPDFMESQLHRPVAEVLHELKENETYSLISEKDVYSLEKWVGVKKSEEDFEDEDNDAEDFEEGTDEEIDENIDIDALLFKALENAKAFGKKMEDNRLKRLWTKVNLPCSLLDAMNRLSKNQMDEIRRNYSMKRLSTLKKSELAEALAARIPSAFQETLYTLDKRTYDFIKKIVKSSGIIPDPGITLSDAEAFIKFGIAFPGIYKSEKVLFMPAETMDIFTQTDGSKLQNMVRRNTEWIRLTRGMLYYYGVMGAEPVRKRMEDLTGEKIDLSEFADVISFACDFNGQIDSTSYGYRDNRVFQEDKIVEEHQKRPEVDYYPFTKKQLRKAGDPDFVDRTPEMNHFLRFVSDHYDVTDQDMNEMAYQITCIINSGSKPARMIIDYLQSQLEFPTSFEFMQVLTEMITDLCNHTRQWTLKGHTPDELFQEEKKFMKPLPKEPFQAGQANSEVINQAKHKKPGRNDPCPCGSGKKYKNCCGR